MAATRRLDRFDLFALVFGGVFALLFVLNLRYYPTELDAPYHLLIGDILSRHGPLFRTDAMEFAPYGRHMGYPPLLHWLIASMRHALHLEPMDIGRALSVFQALALLAGTWWFSRRFFGPCAAFATLVFVTSVSELWWWQTSVAPVSLAYAFFWPGMLLYFDKRWAWTALWLASCFYLHPGLPYVVLLCLIVFGVMMAQRDRSYLAGAISVSAVSVILALPEFLYFSKGLWCSVDPTSTRSLAPSLLSPISWGALAQGFNLCF